MKVKQRDKGEKGSERERESRESAVNAIKVWHACAAQGGETGAFWDRGSKPVEAKV